MIRTIRTPPPTTLGTMIVTSVIGLIGVSAFSVTLESLDLT